jgi:predicted nucleic acid-binding protein
VSSFDRLREALRQFSEETLSTEDYERAAEMANMCMARGVQGSPTDFVVCAVAERLGAEVLTADQDFARYSDVLPVRTHPL